MNITGTYTPQGIQLAASLYAGETLTYTRVVAGSGATASSAAALDAPQQTLSVLSPIRKGSTVTLHATLLAAGAALPYTLTELGVYAKGSNNTEILYKVYRLDTPASILPGARTTLRFYLEDILSPDLHVEMQTAPEGLLMEGDIPPLLKALTEFSTRNIYVSPSGSDETGDGSEASPYRTIQYAVDMQPHLYSGSISIHVAAGTYDEDVSADSAACITVDLGEAANNCFHVPVYEGKKGHPLLLISVVEW